VPAERDIRVRMEPIVFVGRLKGVTEISVQRDSLDGPVAGEPAKRPVGFIDVYEATYSRLVGLAYLTTGANALAEEIVQDAFVDLYRSWDAVDQPEAWVRRAVVSRCTSWVRRRILERRHRDRWREPEPVLHDELAVAVRAALHVLSPRQRAAVVLRFRDDLPEAEIARALSCRPGTVKSLLSRAKAELRKELSK